MQTTLAEDAVLSHIVVGLPQGLHQGAYRDGLPDFDCSYRDAVQAIVSLTRKGLIAKAGPFHQLTSAGTEFMQPAIEFLATL